MNKKSVMFGLATLVLGGFILIPKSVSAYRGDPTVKGPNYTAERHESMVATFANRDYEAWKNLMQNRGRVTQVINKDNFDQFAKAHELALQGKVAEAAQIRQELGLGLHNGSGQGMGMGRNWNR